MGLTPKHISNTPIKDWVDKKSREVSKAPVCECCHKRFDEESQDPACRSQHEFYQWSIKNPEKASKMVANVIKEYLQEQGY